jgi:hypothetical protein
MSAGMPQSIDPAADKLPRPNRWIPLSLRMFVALLLLFGIWTGIRAYRQFVAIREIEQAGGKSLGRDREARNDFERGLGRACGNHCSQIFFLSICGVRPRPTALWHV